MMDSDIEKRKFFRIPYNKVIHYQTLFFAAQTTVPLKAYEVISENLSAFGIFFISHRCPHLASFILLELNPDETSLWKTINENVLMLKGKPVGKVVGIEDKGEGQYGVHVTFIVRSQTISKELVHLTWHKWKKIIFSLLFVSIVIYAVLFGFLNYVEFKETYKPNKSFYITPIEMGLKYDEINFQTEDGKVSYGWFIPAPGAKATVLYLEGREGNICDNLSKERFLNSLGLNVLAFDYRGYGRNLGRPSEQGLYKDARGAYDYLVSRDDVNKERIIVLGDSLGGAVAVDLCLHRKVAALILESSLVSLSKQAQRLFPFLPTDLLLLERYDVVPKIKKIHIPKLIVHGIDDETVAFDDAVSLFYAAPSPKKFLPFHGAHDDSMYKESEPYKAELMKFLDENNLR